MKSEMQEMMRVQQEGMQLLKFDNDNLRRRLAEAEARNRPTVERPFDPQGVEGPPGLFTTHIGTPPEQPIPEPEGARPNRAEERAEAENDEKEKKSKKHKKKKHRRDDSSDSSSSFDQKAIIKLLMKVVKNKKDKDDDDDDKETSKNKPKVKEAEKVVFPKFPKPEQYRNWRIRVREAIVAASDSPDKAHAWIAKVWEKDADEKALRDSEGFSTLDAKIMSALTNILEGDFGRQIDTFKETEAHAGRMVRGRQLLLRLHNYFATNALHGSVYDMEDLMNCKMVNDNLTVFLRNWDTILSGIPVQPDNSVLEPLFHRQVKKCRDIAHDISVYDRALEGTEQRSFQFLYNAANNFLERERLQKNRDRIARQAGGGVVPTTPAPNSPKQKRVPKGFCIDFVRNGSCNKDKCTYKHEMPRGRSRTPGGGRAPSRTPSPGGKGKGKQECKFFKQGLCNRGDKCKYLHKGTPAAPAPGSSARTGSSEKRRRKKDKKERKGRKGSKSSSRSSKSGSRGSSRSSKGSKGSKGSGRRSAPSVPAAVCLLGAMLAGSASQADAFTFRKDMSSLPDRCTPHYHVSLPAVSFNDAVQSFEFQVPKGYDLFPIEDRNKPRVYDKVYPADRHWRTDPDSLREAQTSAKMLQSVVKSELTGHKPRCRFKCDTEFGCTYCVPSGMV